MVLLVSGILWLLLAWIVLRLDLGSVVAVGVLIGSLFLWASVNEVYFAQMVSGGWRFLHYVLAVFFVLGAIWGFVTPVNTVFALASVLGLVLFVDGAFEITRSITIRTRASSGGSDSSRGSSRSCSRSGFPSGYTPPGSR